jgi:hypothetical protein
MSETFTAGEELTMTTTGQKVRVEFGPYTTTAMRQRDTYLVTILGGNSAGTSVQAAGSHLERGPKFTKGDRVLVGLLSTPATVAAGPFPDRDKLPFYVVKHASGSHETRMESNLTKALPEVPTTRTYRLAGVTWDLGATYDDHDGDGWTFTGMHASDGTPLMDSREAGSGYRDYTLTRVLNDFGPLRKRT